MPRKDNLTPSTNYALATNIATVDITGFETDVQVIAPIGTKQRLALNGGVVWLYSKSSQANPSFYISSSARFLGNFSAVYNVGNAMITLTGIYKNRKARETNGSSVFAEASLSKDYFLLNGRASYNFIKNRLGAFVQVDNIFDRTYSDLLGTVMPGRWLQGGLSFNLVK
ncbi:porin family protein [Niabella ginsengisoli]|uniref:TonB-dependent receptor n=1 Tax=Niabella ginsengisoli TaxID=522298 RepID=A0ABS9SMV9_9BACT|nr:TonB-dependent receptor [Niabella ginsengisoli]MCH5599714.1 TonB-dependent receptor [Niabella ginsengisoli]